LSEAFALIVTVPELDEPLLGLVSVIVGRVESGVALVTVVETSFECPVSLPEV